MFSNDELKQIMLKVHPEYLDLDKKGGYKWKTARVFSVVLYPENIENISESCTSVGVPCSLSPLHNADIKDTDSGELKKEHYHLVVYFKGKTTPYNFYTIICGAFGEKAFSTIEIGHDIGALIRYHIHLDQPEKAQYNAEDIQDFNGFNSLNYLVEGGDLMGDLLKLKKLVREKSFLFYAELDDYLEENDTVLWASLHKNRPLQKDILDYCKSREYLMQYQGLVEKGYTKIKLSDNTEKVIFNRQIKEAAI